MATLHASRFTLHASRFIKGFRSAALIGVASLSLAACGGGGGESTDPARLSAVKAREKKVASREAAVSQKEKDQAAKDRQQEKDQAAAANAPMAGLAPAARATVVPAAIREVANLPKIQISGSGSHPRSGRLAIMALQPRYAFDKRTPKPLDYLDTKIPKVVPSVSAGKVSYSFGLYTPDLHPRYSLWRAGSLEQIEAEPYENKIFSLENNAAYTSVTARADIASKLGAGWDYSILKASVPSVEDGAKDSTLYAELWTDRGATGVTSTNYMVGGWWLLAPNKPAGDYRFGVLASGENYYPRDTTGTVKDDVTGEATYRGNAAGLHVSSDASIQRLLGKVTLNADFGAADAKGSIGGSIDELTLDGKSVTGEILLPTVTLPSGRYWGALRPVLGAGNVNPKSRIGNINGVNFKGDWAGTFQGDSSGTDQPTGIVGGVGGSGGGNSFVASFGARKVEDK